MTWHLFSENSLSTSFVVTVWLGVTFLCFFNRRLGWAMSGLVVPGLLAPTLIAKPFIGVVIILEAVITYVVVRGLSCALPRYMDVSALFGRDRFFAMLLISVPVRLVMETWFAPYYLSPILSSLGMTSEAIYDPTGVGLVIAPLLANQIWKPGLWRGLISSVVCLSLTTIAIKMVLIPFTNFDFNNLVLVLDSLSTRIGDAPKAYIILLTTAFIASQVNLRYGWDMGGILFPALLALALFDPLRLAMTLIEAVFLFFAGTLVLQLPWLRSRGVEGASRTLLFFNLAFAYRILSGHITQWLFPNNTSGDFLAIGFLISTMLAIRAADRHSGIQLMSSVGQVSAVGAVVGLLVSVGLGGWHYGGDDKTFPEDHIFTEGQVTTMTPSAMEDGAGRYCLPTPQAGLPNSEMSIFPFRHLGAHLRNITRQYPEFVAPMHSEAYAPSTHTDLHRLRHLVLKPLFRLVVALDESDPKTINIDQVKESLVSVHRAAETLGFSLSLIEPYGTQPAKVILAENPETGLCHRGLVALSLGRTQPFVLTVSRPVQEERALEAGFWLFDHFGARAFISPSAHPLANSDGSADLNRYGNRRNFFVLATEELVRALGDHSTGLIDVKSWNQDTLGLDNGKIGDRSSFPDGIIALGEIHTNLEHAQNLTTQLTRRMAELGLSLVTKDGSRATASARQPTLVIETAAARGGGTLALSVSISPSAASPLTPVLGASSWEHHWQQFGGHTVVVDVARQWIPSLFGPDTQSKPLPTAVKKEFQQFLVSRNFAHLLRLKNRWPHMAIDFVEDTISTAQFLAVRMPTTGAAELFQLHGHWMATRELESHAYLSLRELILSRVASGSQTLQR